MFAAPAFGTCQVTIAKFNPQAFCETVQQERVTRTVLVPTMINVLTQFERLAEYDLSSLVELGYGGRPLSPPHLPPGPQALPLLRPGGGYLFMGTAVLTAPHATAHTTPP